MSKKPLRSQARNIVFSVYQRILEQGAEQTQSSTLSRASVDWLVGMTRP